MHFVNIPFFRSLAAKLLATYVVALLLTIGVFTGLMWVLFAWHIDVTTRFDLENEIDFLQRHLRFDPAGRPIALASSTDGTWIYSALSADLEYRVLDAAGAVILSSPAARKALAPEGQTFDPQLESFDLHQDDQLLHVRTQALGAEHRGYYLQAANSERLAALGRNAFGRIMVGHTLRILLASMVLFVVVVYYTLCRVLKPLRDTSIAAAAIDARNLSTRLETASLPIEFSPAVEAFNLVLDRLERGYRVQQEFLASAAHELKTPLALIRAQIEAAADDDRSALLGDVDFMARQVHQLLHLAEVSEARNYVFETTDVARTADEVVEYLRRLADRHHVYLELHCASPTATTRADRSAMFMLLKNMLENAVQHSPMDGVVTMTIESKQLSIRDEGPGISREDLPRLFTRFWRGAGRKQEGAGLGLAICREIADAHAWDLSARSAGRGAEFILIFEH